MIEQPTYTAKQSAVFFSAIMWSIGALAAGCFLVALLNLREPEIGPVAQAGDGGTVVACHRAGWCYQPYGRVTQ